MFRPSIALVACISLAPLVVPVRPAGANDMWVFDVSGGPTDIIVSRVASTIWGTTPTGPGSGETAVEVHVLQGGDVLPLPVYASDGTTAREEETFWTVALERAACSYHPPSSALSATFDGRTLVTEWSSCHNPGPSDLRFRVTAVAVRGGSVALPPGSFGRAKAAYRGKEDP